MDAVSLHQRGIDNAVASLGTALTEAQGRLLKNYKSKIIIGYDADGAGQEATMRGLEILQNLGYDIRILQIEGAKDPDEFVTKFGSAKFELYLKNAISLIEYKVKRLKQSLDLNQTNDKIKFLNEISKILARTKSSFEKEVYIQKFSEAYGISKEALYGELNKLEYANSKSEKVLERSTAINKVPVMAKKENVNATAKKENYMILLLINGGQNVYNRVNDYVFPDDFIDEQNKKIVKILYEELEKGDISNVIGLFQGDDELLSHVTYILSKELDITDIDKAIKDLLSKFVVEKLQEEKTKMLKRLGTSNLSKDETNQIMYKIKEISDRVKKVKEVEA